MNEQVTIKFASDADRPRLERLAELDSRPLPRGEVVLAEVNGRVVAAVGVDGSVIADPFEPTARVVALLRGQVEGKPARRAPGRMLARLLAYRAPA